MRVSSTMWSRIDDAKAGSREALAALLDKYRPPLVAYVRSRGLSEHDAEDVAQEICLQIIDDDFLRGADRAKGRFRTLLLCVAQHVLASHFRKELAQKRGGGRKGVSLEMARDISVPPEEQDRFDQLWVKNLLRMALERLKTNSAGLKVPYHEVLSMRFLEGKSSREIAEKLNCKPRDVENYVYQGKERLRRYLRELTQELSSSEEEHEDETRLLGRHGL